MAKKSCAECWHFDENSKCHIKNIIIDPYTTKPCKKHDQVDKLVMKARALAAAKKLAKAKAEEERLSQLKLMASLPNWIKVGAKIVEVASGCEIEIINIDVRKVDGISYKYLNRSSQIELTESPGDLIEAVTRGIRIVKGFTPKELSDGFVFSTMNYQTGEIEWSNEPLEFGTDKDICDKYERLKPLWV